MRSIRKAIKSVHLAFTTAVLAFTTADAQELDLTPKVLYEIQGEPGFHRVLGVGVWGLTDVNGDGFLDLLVAGRVDPPGDVQPGTWVYSGFDGRLLQQHERLGEGSLAANGTGFAQLGDLDGDRIADFIAGDSTFGDDNLGRAIIFSGKTGSVIRAHQGSSKTIRFGWGTYALGDLDQDGFIDYGIGLEDPVIMMYSGASGEQIAQIEGRKGLRLVEIDDLNEDGTPDLAVVEDETNVIKFISGTLRGTVGTASLPDNLVLGGYVHDENDGYRFAAAPSGAHTVQKVSDLDGDGFHEILVRRRRLGNENPRALIAISPGKADMIWTADFGSGSKASRYDYESVGEIGDLNGDGVTEFATSLGVGRNPTENFLALISGLDGSFLYTHPFPSISRDLTVISDLDGDGIREVAVGERTWNDDTGKVIIFSFGPASQNSEPYRPGNPQLTVTATPEEVTLAWPAAVTNPQPEWSSDLQTWQPVFDGPAPGFGYHVLPGTNTEPGKYFRLKYEAE